MKVKRAHKKVEEKSAWYREKIAYTAVTGVVDKKLVSQSNGRHLPPSLFEMQSEFHVAQLVSRVYKKVQHELRDFADERK